MPAGPTSPLRFDSSVVNQLACPACLGILRLEKTRLVCVVCGGDYPIVDGIPALIFRSEANPQS
jgi:uncharacterized protein YbaR (Trm112 family)